MATKTVKLPIETYERAKQQAALLGVSIGDVLSISGTIEEPMETMSETLETVDSNQRFRPVPQLITGSLDHLLEQGDQAQMQRGYILAAIQGLLAGQAQIAQSVKASGHKQATVEAIRQGLEQLDDLTPEHAATILESAAEPMGDIPDLPALGLTEEDIPY